MLLKVGIGTLGFLVCLVSIAQGQFPPTPITGNGNTNFVAKFTGSKSVGNTKVAELDSCLSQSNATLLTGDASIAALLCLRDPDPSNSTPKVTALASSPTDAAFWGLNNAPTGGDATGVRGTSTSEERGIGVRGQSVGNAGGGIGVLGEALSHDGYAGVFNQLAPSGYPIALLAYSASPDGGEGVHGRTLATTGLGIGVNGDTSSFDGFGGSFTNFAGGNILRGVNNTIVVFRVDGNGTVFANGGLQPFGADFAESMAVAGERNQYEPGDLLVIDTSGSRRAKLSDRSYSPLVAGIYSTKPGVLASPYKMDNANLAKEVPLAIVGIVPCKVTTENGPISPGDLLVASSTPGHAMKGTDRSRMLGAVLGKALESLSEGKGVIQVLVTLQ